MGLVVTGHYPLNHRLGRLAMEYLEQHAFGWKQTLNFLLLLRRLCMSADCQGSDRAGGDWALPAESSPRQAGHGAP